jgi:hypothetical protein
LKNTLGSASVMSVAVAVLIALGVLTCELLGLLPVLAIGQVPFWVAALAAAFTATYVSVADVRLYSMRHLLAAALGGMAAALLIAWPAAEYLTCRVAPSACLNL